MNTRFLILGVNIVIVSMLIATYGLLTGDNGLVGIGASSGLVGGVFLVLALTPVETTLEALLDYTSTLVNGVTVILEDLDLLDHKLCVEKMSNSLLMVFTKNECPLNPNPGIGMHMGFPYFAIPVNILDDVVKLEVTTEELLETSLEDVLVDRLGLSKALKVEFRGDIVAIHILGLSKTLSIYSKYPVDPLTIIASIAIARLLDTSRLRLLERDPSQDSFKIVLKVEKGA
ncbi:MAG: hypothetical protein QXE81_01910 [Desulfurococcaceae archaeon]